jgi:hypothetical protein
LGKFRSFGKLCLPYILVIQMKSFNVFFVAAVAIVLSGCQTAPSWQHQNLTDPAVIGRRLAKDDGECELISLQSGGSPGQIAAPSSPQAISGTARTYNSQTGATTTSTYSGQVGGPSGGFAGGFASGLSSGAALGEAIRIGRIQDLSYRQCMTSRGWVDANLKADGELKAKPRAAAEALDAPDLYPSAEAAWKADTEEFMRLFPAYKSGTKHETFNARIKSIAALKNLPDGVQYLVETLESLQAEELAGLNLDSEDVIPLYLRAVRGNTRAQAGLGLAYVQKQNPLTPYDPVRAAFWSRKAALAGNSVGQLGYGILLFGGATGSSNRVLGYRWVQKAGTAGLNVESTLQGFEASMTQKELQQAKQ